MIQSVKTLIRTVVPLSVRKQMVLALERRKIKNHSWYTFELLRDFAKKDPNEFHRFLWSNHLAYAESYEIGQRFGEANFHPTRRMLLEDLKKILQERGIHPATDIKSVFDVGCTLGYLLRHAETDLFPSATLLRGLDIDRYAIKTGNQYLRSVGSKIELFDGDVTEVDTIMGAAAYDVVFCCGVLTYLDGPTAAGVVRKMLQHTSQFLVIKDFANADADNQFLPHSMPRPGGDGTLLHNLDRMILEAGGHVAFRRWEGPRIVGNQSVYILIAEPLDRRKTSHD